MEQVLAEIVKVFGASGVYETVQVAPGTIQFRRSYRPTWALVIGWLGVLAMGLGVLLFFVKTAETCTVTVVEGPTGTVVTLSGKVISGIDGQIDAALGVAGHRTPPPSAALEAAPDGTDPATTVDDLPEPSAPAVIAPSVTATSNPSGGGLISGVPGSAPDAVPGPAISASSSPVDETVARPFVAAPSAIQLRLDDGTVTVLGDHVVVGRQPSAPPGITASTAVAVADSTMSVSKTHLSIFRRDGRIWAEDLHSTNGSWVSLPDGTANRLQPGVAAPIDVGTTITFGDRHLEVVASA